MNSMHEANQKRWDVLAPRYTIREEDWRRCHIDPSLGFKRKSLDLLKQYAGDLSGKTACVLGSGDNKAAFALAGLGAKVTSVDISQKQLDVAAEKSRQLSLDIEFVQGDVTDLPFIEAEFFDFACSTNGVMVWITEPKKYYAEACRLLKPGGIFMSYDIHPFQRPWKEPVVDRLEMTKPYFDSGPKENLYNPEDDKDIGCASEAPPKKRQGALSSFHCAWTISELLMAMLEGGFELLHILEEPETDLKFWQGSSFEGEPNIDLLDWRKNPLVGLPAWLTLVAQKKGR